LFGKCESGKCVCEENFFGRLCDKKIFGMNADTFKEVTTLEAYDAFFFREDTEEGEKEVRFDMTSQDGPKMLFLVNESDENNPSYLLRRKGDSEEDKSIDSFFLEHLMNMGEEKRSFQAEKRWVYMTFINYKSSSARIDLQITSKIHFFNKMLLTILGIRSNTLSTISYILYLLITGTMILLFVMIIIVSCFGRRKQRRVGIMPGTMDGPNSLNHSAFGMHPMDEDYIPGFTVGDESDEEEQVFSLTERDYDRWMPVVDISKLKEKGEKLFDDTCTICLDKIENGEKVRQIWTCKHAFHSKCFMDWIKVNESCPNCKAELTKSAMLKKELEKEKESKMKKTKTLTSMDKDKKDGGRSVPMR
jgi:hypothetical protein